MIVIVAYSIPAALAVADPAPLPRAHAHNDYEHTRPLLDALDHGFCGIEADVHLVDGNLFVAHDAEDITPDRTLEALYLKPLQERVKANEGRVYRNGPPILLLIDLKTEAGATFAALDSLLREYVDMLTEFTDAGITERAVTVVISGNRPVKDILEKSPRYAGIDGRLHDLGRKTKAQEYPLISDRWFPNFKWTGRGEMPPEEKAKLEEIVNTAHQHGQKVRFWGLPQGPDIWPVLYEAGVDLINTDDLAALEAFLLGRQETASTEAH
jgi:glycerophosphoryl diester phosphodiesterase